MPLNLVVLADLHHTACNGYTFPGREELQISGPLLLRKALQRLAYEGIQPDALVFLGDAANGDPADAEETALAEVANAAQRYGLPVLAAPGNHDGPADRFARIFGCEPGLHEIGGYGFLLFSDNYAPDDSASRGPDGLRLPKEMAARHPGLPLVALQHNPLHPAIDDPYPYVPTNADAILASYEEAGVLLSLSGHYHAGQPLHEERGVQYATAPALCDAPYRFLHIRLDGERVDVREHALRIPTPGLLDLHCHTEYSYCGKNVSADGDIALSRLLGLERICLVDHTFQLYLPEEEAWSWRWQIDRDMIETAWKSGRGRMPEYRRRAQTLRSDFVRIGLEVDLLEDGSLLLAEEDRDGWDILIGAIHAIHGSTRYGATQADAETHFLRDVERMLLHPIDLLAHPFRFFRRGGLTHPEHLHKPVAEMLAATGVAAEINYHINRPNVRFVEECLTRGVKLALSTDSHDAVEVGELAPHLACLKEAGVRDADLSGVLFNGGALMRSASLS